MPIRQFSKSMAPWPPSTRQPRSRRPESRYPSPWRPFNSCWLRGPYTHASGNSAMGRVAPKGETSTTETRPSAPRKRQIDNLVQPRAPHALRRSPIGMVYPRWPTARVRTRRMSTKSLICSAAARTLLKRIKLRHGQIKSRQQASARHSALRTRVSLPVRIIARTGMAASMRHKPRQTARQT